MDSGIRFTMFQPDMSLRRATQYRYGGCMKSFACLRTLALAVVLAALVVATVVPTVKVSAQSGRQPEKKKVEKKVEEQKANPAAQPEPQEPVPPMPKSTKDDQVIKLSTQVVN